jgi:hypothetical protein
VYRARDTRLGRTVAVKVLARHLADTLEARMEKGPLPLELLLQVATQEVSQFGPSPAGGGGKKLSRDDVAPSWQVF